MNNSKALRHSFEERLKRQGIPLPKDLAEESPNKLIVQDEHGRYWRFNESKTMRWRVDQYGNDLTLKNRFDQIRDENAQWQYLINNHQKDPEVKELLEEERLYDEVGGSSDQWAALDKKKEDLRTKGKSVPTTPVDLRRNNLAAAATVAESSSVVGGRGGEENAEEET